MSTAAHYSNVAAEEWEGRFAGIERIAEHQLDVARRLIGLGMPVRRVLDVGCGTGRMAALYPHATYVGVDREPAFVEYAATVNGGPGRTYLVGDMDNLPFGDGEFDLVVLMGTLEAEPHLAEHIASLKRLVAPGGSLFFNVQNKRNLPGRFANLFGRRYRQRFWSEREVRQAVDAPSWRRVSMASVLLLPPGAAKAVANLAGVVPGLRERAVGGLLALERLSERRGLGLGYEWQVALRR